MKQENKKQFCPNCEAETPCTHEAELFVCDICGEDFAKYIVSRNCNVSDVSMTQDVLTDIKTPRSIENKLTDTEACNARLVEQVEQLTAELARRDEIITRLKEDAERLASTYVAEVYPHEWVCRGCYHSSRDHPGGAPGLIEHDPDCPITLHRELVEKYGTADENKMPIDCNGTENPASDADITG